MPRLPRDAWRAVRTEGSRDCRRHRPPSEAPRSREPPTARSTIRVVAVIASPNSFSLSGCLPEIVEHQLRAHSGCEAGPAGAHGGLEFAPCGVVLVAEYRFNETALALGMVAAQMARNVVVGEAPFRCLDENAEGRQGPGFARRNRRWRRRRRRWRPASSACRRSASASFRRAAPQSARDSHIPVPICMMNSAGVGEAGAAASGVATLW